MVTGTAPHGQGHETSWSMIVADRLGVPAEDVDVLHSDTAISPHGLDTYGSRSLSVGGTAVYLACEKVVEKARAIVAHQLEAAEADLEFVDGEFRVRGTPARAMAIQAVAFEAFTAHDLPDGMEPNLDGDVTWDPPNFTFPFGVHIAVVEIDEETGRVELVRYVAVDDCGNQVNPLIVEGQVHGGVVQGVAQALWEEAVYDADGNLLTVEPARLPGAVGGRRAGHRARPHGDAEPHEPDGGQGHRRGGHDRRDSDGDERGHRRALSATASPTSTCRRRPSGSGKRSPPRRERAR